MNKHFLFFLNNVNNLDLNVYFNINVYVDANQHYYQKLFIFISSNSVYDFECTIT